MAALTFGAPEKLSPDSPHSSRRLGWRNALSHRTSPDAAPDALLDHPDGCASPRLANVLLPPMVSLVSCVCAAVCLKSLDTLTRNALGAATSPQSPWMSLLTLREALPWPPSPRPAGDGDRVLTLCPESQCRFVPVLL